MANAQAQGQHYVRAVKTYQRVLEREPEHLGGQLVLDTTAYDELYCGFKSGRPEPNVTLRAGDHAEHRTRSQNGTEESHQAERQ